MDESKISQKLHRLAEDMVPQDTDIWPDINHKIRIGERNYMKQPLERRWIVARMILVPLIVVVVSLVALTQPARAALLNLMTQGIRLVAGSSIPPTSDSNTTRSKLTLLPTTDLASAQAQVSFVIPLPQSIPSNISFNHATLLAPNGVSLAYGDKDIQDHGFNLEIHNGPRNGEYIFPSQEAHPITIHGREAILFSGAWGDTLAWNEDANLVTITWRNEELTYLLQSSGMSIEDSIHLAESIR